MIKKVVIVLGYLELGGAERQAIYLADYLHHHTNVRVKVIGLNKPGRVSQVLSEKNISWEYIPIEFSHKRLTMAKSCLKLLRYFWHQRPRVIIPFTYWPNLLCGLIWRLTTAKVCIWNQRDEGRGMRHSRLENVVLKNVSGIISNNLEGKLFLETNFNISNNKVKIIHNGVVLSNPEEDILWWHQKLAIAPETFTVLMVANLHVHKDHATLLKAWKLFTDLAKDNKVALLLAGRLDDQYDNLKSLAKDLQICDSVNFLGPVKDISGLLRAVDLVAFSSKKEGCPNSVLEAMRAQKPVVATDICGIREALGEEYPYFVKPDNADDFSQKVFTFYQNPVLIGEVGYRNEKYVTEKFSMRKMQDAYLSLIQGEVNAQVKLHKGC